MKEIKEGQKIEIQDPEDLNKWYPGTITKIVDKPPAIQYEITCEGEDPDLMFSYDFDDYINKGWMRLVE